MDLKKDKIIRVCLDSKEKARIERAAKLRQRPTSQWCRLVLLDEADSIIQRKGKQT